MNLYFIDGIADDDFNVAAFVRAENVEQAFQYWKESDLGEFGSVYFKEEFACGKPVNATEDDLRFFLVPEGNKPGLITWHAGGVDCVAYVEPAH